LPKRCVRIFVCTVFEKSGRSLVTKLTRLTDSKQVVPTSL
jgi:hypothetical protein